MERMYQEFKEIAEFRMVYIKEAHAADSNWAVPYAKEKGITEHDDYEERCTTAEMLLEDESLTIPCLIDSMDDAVNRAYRAWPDRVFVVRTDGRLAVAAEQGPRGFQPGLKAASEWLEAFKRDGAEPPLAGEARDDNEGEADDSARELEEEIASITAALGTWNMKVEMGERVVDAVLVISFENDGSFTGTWTEGGRTSDLVDVEIDGDMLHFKRRISDQRIALFEGQICGEEMIGKLRAGEREIIANATKKSDA